MTAPSPHTDDVMRTRSPDRLAQPGGAGSRRCSCAPAPIRRRAPWRRTPPWPRPPREPRGLALSRAALAASLPASGRGRRAARGPPGGRRARSAVVHRFPARPAARGGRRHRAAPPRRAPPIRLVPAPQAAGELRLRRPTRSRPPPRRRTLDPALHRGAPQSLAHRPARRRQDDVGPGARPESRRGPATASTTRPPPTTSRARQRPSTTVAGPPPCASGTGRSS